MEKFGPRLLEKTERIRKRLRKKIRWNWTKDEEADFTESKKTTADIPLLTHFARDQVEIATTDGSRTNWDLHYGRSTKTKQLNQSACEQ